jgi:hypothetical protein
MEGDQAAIPDTLVVTEYVRAGMEAKRLAAADVDIRNTPIIVTWW